MKDYTSLLGDRVWGTVEKKLTAGISNDYMKGQMKTILENTRQSLLSDTQMQNITYLNLGGSF
jgi:hypothetical protein